MTTLSDNGFARVTKESIVRDPTNTASLTGNDIAYSTTETINEKIDSMVALGGGNSAIQFKDEGVALGTPGTVDEVDFTGAGVTTTRASNKITVNIPLGGGGVTDHGALTGLADDDHTQYTKADGTRAFTGKQSYSTHPTFSADTELVDKKYVDDSIAAGGGYTDEQAQDAVGNIFTDSSTIDFTYNDATPSITGVVIDGSISTTKLGGDITAAGKALLDDADAATQRTTLGLGSLATQSGTFSGTSSGTNSGDVTLAGTPNYLTIVGQVITRGLIDLASHVTGLLPFANIANVGTGTVMYRKTAGTGAMESQTLATLKTDLNLTGTNSGDQTSIVGITGTTAQFNTALTDGDFATIAGTETLTNKTLTTPIIGSIKGTVVTDTDGATITFDKNAGGYHRVVLGGNRTLAVSNMAAGDTMVIDLVQDATGSRTVTWFTTIKWVGGTAPTLTTAANKIDTFGVLCTSAGNYQVYILGQNI